MALNLFKFCSGLRALGYLMIVLVGVIIAVSYYAVVVLTWGPQLFHGGFISVLSFFIISVFHVLLVLLTWSYFMVVFRDPGSVPGNWKTMLGEEDMETGGSMSLPQSVAPEASSCPNEGTERRLTVGYCSRCQNSKPPRCHHCSIFLLLVYLPNTELDQFLQKRCVLKMDHHCVWVVNCVGARNYKFFLLFLLYTFLETTLDTLALLPHFIKFFGEAKNRSVSPGALAITVLAFVINLAFALSLLCFLVMHASLLSNNTTTIEVHDKKKTGRWKYDLGRRENFKQVFGKKKALWFFPLFAKEDLECIPALRGLDFPTRPDDEP